MDVLHAAVWVSDLEGTVAFYEELLDLEYSRETVGSDGVRNYFVTGESDAELQFKHDDGKDVTIEPGTMDHLAVAVDDVDATADRAVEEWGSEVVDGPRTLEDAGLRIAFITDPEGYTVEIIEEL